MGLHPRHIEGLVEWNLEQVTLGVSKGKDLFAKATPQNKPAADPQKHVFKMVRVQEGTTCADIVAQQESLFDF